MERWGLLGGAALQVLTGIRGKGAEFLWILWIWRSWAAHSRHRGAGAAPLHTARGCLPVLWAVLLHTARRRLPVLWAGLLHTVRRRRTERSSRWRLWGLCAAVSHEELASGVGVRGGLLWASETRLRAKEKKGWTSFYYPDSIVISQELWLGFETWWVLKSFEQKLAGPVLPRVAHLNLHVDVMVWSELRVSPRPQEVVRRSNGVWGPRDPVEGPRGKRLFFSYF